MDAAPVRVSAAAQRNAHGLTPEPMGCVAPSQRELSAVRLTEGVHPA